jgi:hypothetical protein
MVMSESHDNGVDFEEIMGKERYEAWQKEYEVSKKEYGDEPGEQAYKEGFDAEV